MSKSFEELHPNYRPTAVLRPYKLRHEGDNAPETVASILARGLARGVIPTPGLAYHERPLEERKRIVRSACKRSGMSRARIAVEMRAFHPDAREILEGQPSPASRNPPGTRALETRRKSDERRRAEQTRIAAERALRDEKRAAREADLDLNEYRARRAEAA